MQHEVATLDGRSSSGAGNRGVSPSHLRPVTERWVHQGLHAALIRRPEVRMVPGSLRVDGRQLAFAISDNEDAHGPDGPGTPPVWAVNIHGYLAGGWLYARESARLAERLGWRLVNPSLPGFGGSDPLGWQSVSMEAMAEAVEAVLRHVDAGPVVLIGHSMGGAIAVEHAASRPDEVLGIIYRAGVATPAWQRRRGVVARVMAPILPDLADGIDLLSAVALDTPDLLVGRLYSTVRSVLPEFRTNLRHLGQMLPVGNMLMLVDLSERVRELSEAGMPLLAEWGCFDRVVPPEAAAEFSRLAGTPVHWVPGGHSWMVARPQGQADLLSFMEWGTAFRERVDERWRERTTGPGDSRSPSMALGPGYRRRETSAAGPGQVGEEQGPGGQTEPAA